MTSLPLSQEERELLEAAARLLDEVGHEGFTMDRLAADTGLSRATLYRRHGNREAILQRLSEEGLIDAELAGRPDVRTRILRAARVVFIRSGIAEASIEEIAREAAVGQATVYRQFKDREGLLRAFVEHMRPIDWVRELRLDPSGDIEADLYRIMSRLVRALTENRDLMLIVLTEKLRHPELIQRIGEAPDRTQVQLSTWIEARIRSGHLAPGDAFDMAGILMGMTLSLAVLGPAFYGRDAGDSDRLARLITRTFLDGLRASGMRRK